jgi:hypothetical protein
MQIRHRTPTIFNLSMVDVLCCALGCVILLWLLNLREAKQRAATAGETSEQLKAVQSSLDQTAALLRRITGERDEVARQAETAARDRDQIRKDRDAARDELTLLEKRLATLSADNTTVADRLAKLTRAQQALTKEKADVTERLTKLESALHEQEGLTKSTTRRADDLAEQVRVAEARAKKLQGELEESRVKLAAAEQRTQSMESDTRGWKKDLADANRTIDQLQREKKVLADQASRARAAVENRFEGIALTGRRVIFLVDMSGSMELVDERTPDANKWVGVRDTLGKVMRSLPELEKFQVILFSEKVSYLLGNDGRWLDYDAKTSANQVVRELAAIKPLGATNMHDAFETAFRFRRDGLDTIYVLSDGLPNIGPGLTPEQANIPKETERSEILARYIRNLLRRDWNRPLADRPRVRINTIGFFFESPDVGAFLWALARENDGSFVGMSRP